MAVVAGQTFSPRYGDRLMNELKELYRQETTFKDQK